MIYLCIILILCRMYDSLLQLDKLRLNFSTDGLFVINIILAFIMFGVALNIKGEHFKTIFLQPKPFVIGLINQNVIIPFSAFVIVLILHSYISPTVAMGMILIAACPGGNISNFMTNYARGNTALAVSLTATTTLLSLLFTPFNFALWGGLYVKYLNKHSSHLLQPISINPWEMAFTVFILLGIPLLLGLFMTWKLPRFTKTIAAPLKNLSIVIFMALVIVAFSNNFNLFIHYIWYVFLLVLIENGLSFFIGFTVSKSLRLKQQDVRAITIESGIHNSGLALALLFNPKIFPTHLAIGGMFFVAGWWAIWHIISGLTISMVWSNIPLLEDKR